MSKKGIFSSHQKKKPEDTHSTRFKSKWRDFLLDFFFVTFFSLPLKHPSTNKRTPNVMNGTCRAAQRPEQVSKAKLLLRQTPADIPACQLSLLPSPGVTSPQYLTQGDPSASSTRSLSSGLSCILNSGGFSCLNFLQEHLLSVFLAAPAHSGSWITTPGSYKVSLAGLKAVGLEILRFQS